MKQARKVLCIIGVGIIGVLLAVSTVYACCGMDPVIADDPVVPECPGDEVTISGTVTAYDEWQDQDPCSYSTDLAMTIEVERPGDPGDPCSLVVTLSNLQEWEAPEPGDGVVTKWASWDFSAPYTPPEVGTYTYTKTAMWTTDYDTETRSVVNTFEVVWDCTVDIDIKGGSCPNPLNPKEKENPQGKGNKGSIPVAILAAADYDLADIDLSTLTLNGVPVIVNPDGTIGIMEDSTQPPTGDPADCYDCFDADDPANYNCDLWNTALGLPVPPAPPDGILDAYCGDGIPERVVKFDTTDVAATIAGPLPKGACVVLELAGQLLDGRSFTGTDSMILTQPIK